MLSRKNVAIFMAELLGTGVLTMVALTVSRSALSVPYFIALAVGLALTMLVLMVGSISGAQVNPAVTLGLWSMRKIGTIRAVAVILAQFAGAVLAWRLFTYLVDGPVQDITSTFDWRVLAAEAVGTFVFTFGIAAAVFQKYEGGKLAATIGGSLVLGILIATSTSTQGENLPVANGLLNPALALGVQSWSKAYVAGPVIGALVGMNLYALLFAPADSLAKVVKTKTVKQK